MHYYSTNHKSPQVSFREAAITGQPHDKGLYFPSEIPQLSPAFLQSFRLKSKAEIAFEVIRPYINGEIPDAELFGICEETEEVIEPERLRAIPWTRLSIEGAEIRESVNKRYAR